MRCHENLNQPHLLAVTKQEVLCSTFLTLLVLMCSVGLLIHLVILKEEALTPCSHLLLAHVPRTCLVLALAFI